MHIESRRDEGFRLGLPGEGRDLRLFGLEWPERSRASQASKVAFDCQFCHAHEGRHIEDGAGDVASDPRCVRVVKDGIVSEIGLVDVELRRHVFGEPVFIAQAGIIRRGSI